MPGRPNAISNHLRDRKRAIASEWQTQARQELPLLSELDESALENQTPELVDALATWVERDTRVTREAFTALADGHALQRLQLGIDLLTLTREYALLRHTIVREVLTTQGCDAIRETMPRIHAGLDDAVQEGVRRYTRVRDQVRDRLVGILADDLRAPIDAVAVGSARILAVTDHRDPLYRVGTAISRSVQRIAQIVGDVVELARGHLGGAFALRRSACDLSAIAQDVIEELRLAYPDRSIRLETLGDSRGSWDHDRVRQAASYLLTNALQHGDDPIHVRIIDASDHDSISFAVTNSGPVIGAERLAHLFDPLRSPRSAPTRGIGLGLYIVRRIALAHGGRCEVQSNHRDGTTFTLVLPRVET